MIIPSNQVTGILKTYQEQNNVAKAGKANKGESARSPQQPDEVILSSQVQTFGSVLQSVRNLSDVRQDKVDAYSKAIEEGSYHVAGKAIADKMIGRVIADNIGE